MNHGVVTLRVGLSLGTAVEASVNVLRVAGMFGLGLDEQREMVVIPPTELTLRRGEIVFVTGPSGSGKSSLLRLIAEGLAGHAEAYAQRLEDLPALADKPLVDCFAGRTLEEVTALLAVAGLNDAWVMLRRPGELSDGQRYRLRLAQGLSLAGKGWDAKPQAAGDMRTPALRPSPQPSATPGGQEAAGRWVVLLADEFGATLDRVTAKVIARNVRKWVKRSGACLVVATTHDDLLESLAPDVLVYKDLGGGMEVLQREGFAADERG